MYVAYSYLSNTYPDIDPLIHPNKNEFTTRFEMGIHGAVFRDAISHVEPISTQYF